METLEVGQRSLGTSGREGDIDPAWRSTPGPQFYIDPCTGTDAARPSLFAEAQQRAWQPEAAEALSAAVTRRWAAAMSWIEHHPLLEQAGVSQTVARSALASVEDSCVVMQALFTTEALLSNPAQHPFYERSRSWERLQESLLYAIADGRSPQELRLLAIAAVFMDMGRCTQEPDPALASQRLATTALEALSAFRAPTESYSAEEVESVRRLMQSAQVNWQAEPELQVPAQTHELKRYLLDAQLAFLSSESCTEKAMALYAEERRGAFSMRDSDLFLAKLQRFAADYHYQSQAAQSLHSEGKQLQAGLLAAVLVPGI